MSPPWRHRLQTVDTPLTTLRLEHSEPVRYEKVMQFEFHVVKKREVNECCNNIRWVSDARWSGSCFKRSETEFFLEPCRPRPLLFSKLIFVGYLGWLLTFCRTDYKVWHLQFDLFGLLSCHQSSLQLGWVTQVWSTEGRKTARLSQETTKRQVNRLMWGEVKPTWIWTPKTGIRQQ